MLTGHVTIRQRVTGTRNPTDHVGYLFRLFGLRAGHTEPTGQHRFRVTPSLGFQHTDQHRPPRIDLTLQAAQLVQAGLRRCGVPAR